jgi:hypothetical protein
MKHLIFAAFMLLASIKSNGQEQKDTSIYSNLLVGGSIMHGIPINKSDTIRTLLLITDTSMIQSVGVTRENWKGRVTTLTDKHDIYPISTIAIIGYRIVRNGMYLSVGLNHVEWDALEYLDDKKKSLPKSFFVITYKDLKQ